MLASRRVKTSASSSDKVHEAMQASKKTSALGSDIASAVDTDLDFKTPRLTGCDTASAADIGLDKTFALACEIASAADIDLDPF